tara:strand:+ start:229 stop:1368 length:1140 start_codon:yes stop_codon:yes gene_type:complete
MRVGRRRAIALIGLGGVATVGFPLKQLFAASDKSYFVSSNSGNFGSYSIAVMTQDGCKVFETALPYRAHGIAYDRVHARIAIVARRPGRSIDIISISDGCISHRLNAPVDHHFYGHAVFSPHGDRLYTTENQFETGDGIIGVWDLTSVPKRLRQFPSYGVGPHEIVLNPNGKTLIVANGGIRTHPETGRRKLNLPIMSSNLTYIDRETGAKLVTTKFEGERLRTLSIRHLAITEDETVCLGLQDQNPQGDSVPLVAIKRRGSCILHPVKASSEIIQRMRSYTGSVAFDSSFCVAAVSAPRGNFVTFWDISSGMFLHNCPIIDGCGVAPTGEPGEFLLTSGAGGLSNFNALTGKHVRLSNDFIDSRRWDNHLLSFLFAKT